MFHKGGKKNEFLHCYIVFKALLFLRFSNFLNFKIGKFVFIKRIVFIVFIKRKKNF